MSKNQFDTEENQFGGGAKGPSPADSPDQVGILWNRKNEAVSAIPVPSQTDRGNYDMDISRLPSNANLLASLSLIRENQLDIDAFTQLTQFLTASSDFSERTRILALDGEILAFNDLELFEWLINAERQMYLGTDSHPVFENPLEDTACSVVRLPNGQIAMTEVSREAVNTARGKMRALFGEDAITALNLTIETPLRSAARYFLTAVGKGVALTRAGRESELTAVLLISRSGFSYGLWSASTGLFSEYAFQAPVEIRNQPSVSTGSTGKQAGKSAQVSAESESLNAYIKHAFEQISLQFTPERLEQLNISGYAQVVWASEPDLAESVEKIAKEYSEEAGISMFEMGVPMDEAVAAGLLFGSFTFGDETALGAETLPQVNLGRDLLVLADKEEVERRRIEQIQIKKRRSNAVFMLLAAPVFVLAFLTAMVADHIVQQTVFTFREVRADARTVELKPALDRRKSYEANLKWYQEFITQVSRLRKQQPLSIGMLYQLNSSYPFDLDPAFYVSELKLKKDAGIEITGLAKNKDAVTSFLRSLEFAGGAESGSRLFSNLTYEVQEGVAQPALPAGTNADLPTISGSTLSDAGPPPGIIAWTIRGNYLPMAQYLPPDPKNPAASNAAAAGPPGGPAVNNPPSVPPAGAPATGVPPAPGPGQ